MSDIIVWVQGGCVIDVTDEHNNDLDYCLIDQDVLEEGECPYCGKSIEEDEQNICSNCGINWDTDDSETILKKRKLYRESF